MAGRFLSVFTAVFIFSFSFHVHAIEFRGAEYDVYLGDVNDDGIDDIYLKVPDTFVLLHGSISVPLLIDSEVPSYLISSIDGDLPSYASPVVSENIDESLLAKVTSGVYLVDQNGDGVLDLLIDKLGSMPYNIVLNGDLSASFEVLDGGVTFTVTNNEAVIFNFPTAQDPADDLPAAGEIYYGNLGGSFNVSEGGSATYSLPIDVPPGIQGMQPKLSLSYSSDAFNGLLGWGWNISGLSSISRCRASIARDGYVSGISSGDNYHYCLDGERLVLVDSAASEYRTERESFRRITKNGDTWLVESPDGASAHYGSQSLANSKQLDGDGGTITWKLDKKEDVSGNYLTVSYESDAVGAGVRIKNIEYTKNSNADDINNSVEFWYENRPDVRTKYIANTLFKSDQRLKRIETKVNSVIVTSYILDYEIANGTSIADPANTSRIESIKKCYSGTTVCANPVVFDWTSTKAENYILDEDDKKYVIQEDVSEERYSEERGSPWGDTNISLPRAAGTRENAAGLRPLVASGIRGDFDGDGKDEVIWTECPDPLTVEGCDRKIALSSADPGATFATFPRAEVVTTTTSISGETEYSPAESVNFVSGGFGQAAVSVTHDTTSTNVYPLKEKVIDLNGDGLDDYYIKGLASLDVFISDGTTLNYSEAYSLGAEAIGGRYATICCVNGARISHFWSYGVYLQDVNGDQLPDLIRVPAWHSGGNSVNIGDLGVDDISVALNEGDGEGFGAFSHWATSTDYAFIDTSTAVQATRFVDVSGDGLVDMVGLTGEVGLNTGSSFVWQDGWADSANMPDIPSRYDIITVSNESMGGLDPMTDHFAAAYAYSGVFNPVSKSTYLSDVNGDGLVDWIAIRDAGVYVALAKGDGYETAELWSTAITLSDLAPYCDMMECNTVRRGLLVQDLNKDGLSDIVFTEAWFIGENSKENESRVLALFSNGHHSINQPGFSEPVLVAEVPASGARIAISDIGVPELSRIGKPMVSEEGAFVVHLQPSFMNAEFESIFTSLPLLTVYDVAVDVGVQRHKMVGITEGSVRSLTVDYQKLSRPEVYSQSYDGVDEKLRLGRTLPTVYQNVTGSAIPDTSFPAAFRGREVVAQVDIDLLGEASEKQEYHYFNQKRSRSGFGSLGFEKREQTTTFTGHDDKVRLVQQYYQEVDPNNTYALVAPKNTTRCIVTNTTTDGCSVEDGAKLLSEVKQNWKVRLYDDTSPHYYPYMLDEQTKSYDLVTGELVNTIRKRMFDDSVRTSCPSFSELDMTSRTTDTDEHFDAYGTPLDIVENRCDTFGVTGTHTENTNITENLTDWCLNQVQDPKVHTWVYDVVESTTRNATRHTNYVYHTSGAGLCQVSSETREPNAGNELWLKTDYLYNAYGSKNDITETVKTFTDDGISFTSRDASINESFNISGERTVITTNALGHEHTEIYNAEFGSIKEVDDANGLTSEYYYDVLGRLSYAENLGVITTYDYRTCDACFDYNSDAEYYVHEKTEGQSATRTYYDGLNRQVGTRWRGLTGTYNYTGQKYTAQGLPEYITEPFSGASYHETRTHYDVLGRTIQTDFPTSASQTVDYTVIDGAATVITTDTANQSTEQRFDALGREKLIKDALNIEVHYWHDAQGNITDIRVTDSAENDAIDHHIQFDLLGRKTQLVDPDVGTIDYTYNAFGHLATQTNGENERICYVYDKLDRQIERRDSVTGSCSNATLHTWAYDREGEKGLLAEVTGRDTKNRVQSETYSYTLENLLPETTTQVINGESFSVTSIYDDFNRPIGFSYPTGFTLEQRYNDYGIAHQSVNAITGDVLWEATADDVRGNLTNVSYGNGASVVSTFRAETGLLQSRLATLGTTALQNQSFIFDDEGNLRSRTDNRVSVTQSFCYDPLYRLTDQVINSSCADDVNGSYSGTAYAYDIHGNITRKEGINDYAYGQSTQNAGPHAVSFADGNNYLYDNAGRMIGGFGGRVIEYSAFGKPTYMGFENGYQTEVTYGVLQKRVQRGDIENGQLTHTVYVDKFYERIDKPDGTREHRHYMNDWGVHVIDETITESYNVYFTRDHIGSLASKSDDRTSPTIKYHANEPWGRRQNQDWNGMVYDTLEGAELEEMTFATTRGFTDHEHLDGVGLIHMNGRVYDPVVGRFVSPDPWIQDPTNSQSFNRYTYVWNNPLRYTDPTGELAFIFRRGMVSDGTKKSKETDETIEDLNAGVEVQQEGAEEDKAEISDVHKAALFSLGAIKEATLGTVTDILNTTPGDNLTAGALMLFNPESIEDQILNGLAASYNKLKSNWAAGNYEASGASLSGVLVPLVTRRPSGVGGVAKSGDKFTTEIVKRNKPGRDGGQSQHIKEKVNGTTTSTTHQVTLDGKVIHQHQDHIGKHGTVRRFSDELTGTKTINAPTTKDTMSGGPLGFPAKTPPSVHPSGL